MRASIDPPHRFAMLRGPAKPDLSILVAAVLVSACGAGAAARAPAGPPPDRADAVAEARGLAQEIERGLARGNATGLAPLCAIDLVAIGPRAGDGGRARGDALIVLGDALPGKKHRVKVRDLRVESAPGGRAAWLTEQLDVDGKRHAVTAVAAEVDGLWVITAVMVGASWPAKALRDPAAGGAAALPARATAPAVGNRPAAAEPLAAFAGAVAHVDARLAQLDGERAVVLGPLEKAAWRGERAIGKAWKKGGPRWTLVGEPQAGATPDGEVVWIAAAAETIEASGPGRPRRLFAIYRRADRADRDGGWRLAVLHESVVR